MNLQSIQKRVAELTAELLTISNDLEFILSGPVERPAIVVALTHFGQVRTQDVLLFSAPFTCIDGHTFKAGQYTVTEVEVSGYDGCWSVELSNPNGDSWINFNQIAKTQFITKVGA